MCQIDLRSFYCLRITQKLLSIHPTDIHSFSCCSEKYEIDFFFSFYLKSSMNSQAYLSNLKYSPNGGISSGKCQLLQHLFDHRVKLIRFVAFHKNDCRRQKKKDNHAGISFNFYEKYYSSLVIFSHLFIRSL